MQTEEPTTEPEQPAQVETASEQQATPPGTMAEEKPKKGSKKK